jgi:hypothetical protein
MGHKTKQELFVEKHSYGTLVLYEITGDEVELLENETLIVSEDFSFALAALSVAISFAITLATTTIESDRTFTVFCLFVIVGFIATLFFGVRWFRGRKKVKSVLKRIRERSGPLGEEGKELAVPDLDELQPQPPTPKNSGDQS